MKRIAYTITPYTTVIRLLGVVQNPANGFPARPLGLCSDCSNQTEEGKRYCPSCSKIRDERIARLRNGRKDLGLCQDCGEPAISGLTRCSTCAERRRITMSRLRARRRLHGTCQNCSNEAIHEQNLCASCAVKQRARKGRNRQTIKDPKNG